MAVWMSDSGLDEGVGKRVALDGRVAPECRERLALDWGIGVVDRRVLGDRSSYANVLIALLVDKRLDLLIRHLGLIYENMIVHRTSRALDSRVAIKARTGGLNECLYVEARVGSLDERFYVMHLLLEHMLVLALGHTAAAVEDSLELDLYLNPSDMTCSLPQSIRIRHREVLYSPANS